MYIAPTYNHYILRMEGYVLYSISPALYQNACHVRAGELSRVDERCILYSHGT